MKYKRIVTSAVLILLVTLVFLLRKIDARFFCMLVYVCSIFGTFEMVRALKDRITIPQKVIVGLFALIFTPIYTFTNNMELCVLIIFIAIVLCLLLLVFQFEKTSLESVGFSAISIIYPTVMLFPMLIVNSAEKYAWQCLLLIFVVSPCSDTFAYVVGSTFKGKKMAEKISPKKTVSGGIGGIVGGIIGSIVLCIAFTRHSLIFSYFWQDLLLYLFVGAVGGFVTEIGDLVEGAIKRKLGIKDMGTLMPGHGGMLDRIDGIIITSLFVSLVFLFIK